MLMYEQHIKNVSFICGHFGISKKTFYKWRKRYLSSNKDPSSLADHSRKPKHSPNATKEYIIRLIIKLRKKTNFGPDRIHFYLIKDFNLNIPRSTIYAILKRKGLIKRHKRSKKQPLLYNLPNPGDNVQIDIKMIGGYGIKRAVQYSAIDDATRIKLTRIYSERANHYSVDFLNYIVSKFPFKIKCIS